MHANRLAIAAVVEECILSWCKYVRTQVRTNLHIRSFDCAVLLLLLNLFFI